MRFRRRFTERVSGEAFVQHEYNEFRRLQLRALLGAGPRFVLFNEEATGLTFGTVGIGFNLTYDSAPPATVPAMDTQLRTTVGVKF
ncbi:MULTISPECIES: DUF481 domain-containing protein [Corallococcus]|uniref:DUF481 domain-containing protein n=1 Tax=Corallococcus TaxID=83461 RepID=UPI001F2E2512